MSIRCISDSPTVRDVPAPGGLASWEVTPRPRLASWLKGAALSVAAAVAIGMTVREFGATRTFFSENGPIEFFQAACLAGVALVFALVFLRSRGSRALFCLAATYAIVLAVTREMPRCGSTFYDGGACLSSVWKTGVIVAASGVALLALALRPIEWSKALRLGNIRWIWPSFIVVAMLVAAETAEHFMFEELEEALELTAYLYLGTFGLWILAYALRPTPAAGRLIAPSAR